MSVILLILEIIGIVLLIILGILLLLLIMVLMIPVRYQITGEIEESATVKVKVHWLLHLFLFQVFYENNELKQKWQILGITIRKKDPKKQEEKEQRKAKKQEEKEQRKAKKQEEKEQRKAKKQEEKEQRKAKKEEGREQEQRKAEKQEERQQNQKKAEKREETKTISIGYRIQQFFLKIKAIPGMIKEKWENLKSKIKTFRELVIRIATAIQKESYRDAVKAIWKELKYLLKHISPRKVNGDIIFGMSDPASTGQILGMLHVLPLLHRYELQVQPDFETEIGYVRGTFDIRGYARGVHILILFCRLLKDGNVRSLLKR